MKCRYTFKAISELALSESLHFSHDDRTFKLVAESGRLSAIVVEQVKVAFREYPKMAPPSQGKLARVTIPQDPLLPFVQLEMKAIRGALAFWGVYDLEIESPKIEWTPENEEERKATDVFGYTHSSTPLGKGRTMKLPLDQIIRTLLSREAFTSIEIPLEFFRRGRIDLHEQRFIEAIYDFFFVLEYLFADGKFTKHGAAEAMIASNELVAAIQVASVNPMPAISKSHSDRAEFDSKFRGKNVDQIVAAILELRGLLHHQSAKHKKNWNPAAPEQFKVDAYFLCAVAHAVVIKLATALVFEPKEDAVFKTTAVLTDKGEKISWKPMPD